MKSKKRKNYTKAFKEEPVKLITDEGYSSAEAGRNLGVNPSLISRWKRELEGDGSEGVYFAFFLNSITGLPRLLLPIPTSFHPSGS